MTLTTTKAGSWIRSASAVPRILAIAGQLQGLLLQETCNELSVSYDKYTPWMSVRSRRNYLSERMKEALPSCLPVLISDREDLDGLAQALAGRAGPFGAIVQHDIGAEIVAEADLRECAWTIIRAKEVLQGHCAWIHELLEKLITYIVPITYCPNGVPMKRGFSTPLCYGAVFLTFAERTGSIDHQAFELAVDLAHEVGHHVLHTYQAADPILASDLRAPVYSGVKCTERPAIMALHASIALSYMLEVCGSVARSRHVDAHTSAGALLRCSEMLKQQRRAIESIRSVVVPTSLGDRIIAEMEEQVSEYKNMY